MNLSVRRLGALLAVTAAALAAFAVTATGNAGDSSTRADSVWSIPADQSSAPATGTPIAAPADSVW